MPSHPCANPMILAIDLGSSHFKAAVFDRRMAVCGRGSSPVRHQFSSGGRVELEVADATEAFRDCVAAALRSASVDTNSLEAIAVTSQAQTFTIVGGDGRARMPFISWQDARAERTCEWLKRDPRLARFGDHSSFGEILPVLTICQIAHLKQSRPGFLRSDDRIMHLPTYLVRHLTGESVVDSNLAAMCGLYSLPREDWYPEALEVCGIRPEQLGHLVAIGEVAAHTAGTAAEFGIAAGIPVILAGNDQTAGAYGARLHESGGLLLTLGTAQVAYVCSTTPAPSDPALVRGPYPGNLHYRLAADGCGGAVVTWAQGVLSGCSTDASFFASADQSEPGCRGLVFDAELPSGAGTWKRIGLHHTVADFARAVIESLSCRMADQIRRLGVDPAGVRVLAAGGGSRASTWLRIQSETIGAPITAIDATPLDGAAGMAWAAIDARP
ncbi:MAG: hypothetical protein GXY83_17805 [Rhodopirellula sp.]|nr:hypothetical protein [Rhodopirellula sp.]